jgi:hypothetical protein
MAFVLLFGRFFWYYTVTQKAAHDAAVFLANAPLSEIKSNDGSAEFASKIIAWETGDIDSITIKTLKPTILCGYKVGFLPTPSFSSCTAFYTPIAVQAVVVINVTDPFLSPITNAFWGANGIPIMAISTISYVGQ